MLMLHMLSCFSSQFSIEANYFDDLLCVFSKKQFFFFKHQMLCAGLSCPNSIPESDFAGCLGYMLHDPYCE